MKIIKRFVMLVLVIGLFGCSSQVEPIKEYYAIINEAKMRLDKMDLVYDADEKKYQNSLDEINYLLERSNEVELKGEDQELQKDLYQKAQEYLEATDQYRKEHLKSMKLERKGDYSYIDKVNIAMEEQYEKYAEFHRLVNKIMFTVDDDSRKQKLDIAAIVLEKVFREVEEANDVRHAVANDERIPTANDYKKIDTAVANAQEKIDEFKETEVSSEDQDMKDEAIEKAEAVLKEIEKSKKSIKDDDTFKINEFTYKLNSLVSDMYIVDIFYNLESKPFLPEDVVEELEKMSS